MRALELLRVLGPASLQDLGRPGQLHLGLPRGGTLAPSELAALNADLGNADAAPALEIFGTLVARALDDVLTQLDGEAPRLLPRGATLTVRPDGRRLRLLAVAGAFLVPEVLGGRGLLPSAGLGGRFGRFLATGDVLPIGVPGTPRARAEAHTHHGPVRLFPGPHFAELRAPEQLTSTPWILDVRSDRTGLCLAGPALALGPRDPEAASLPMVPGAVQVPPSGSPIVLGPDHPVTGGYPVVAVVARGDLERLFTQPLGGTVRFALCD